MRPDVRESKTPLCCLLFKKIKKGLTKNKKKRQDVRESKTPLCCLFSNCGSQSLRWPRGDRLDWEGDILVTDTSMKLLLGYSYRYKYERSYRYKYETFIGIFLQMQV